jgi:hypothetical protein
MRVRLISWHSNLSWVVFIALMRARDARLIPSCFHNGWEQKSWKDAWARNPKSFQAWMRVRLISRHSNLS